MTPPAEQQPLSRRQLRELQRTGRIPTTPLADAPENDAPDAAVIDSPSTEESVREAATEPPTETDGTPYAKVVPEDEVIETAVIVPPPSTEEKVAEPVVPVIPADGVPLTRRQARELERARTASITVITADQGAVNNESGEIVTAEAIEEPTGEHAPVTEPDTELELVEKHASETGDLTEVVVDDEPVDEPVDPVVVVEDFGAGALEVDGDPLAEERPFDTLIATGIAEADAGAETEPATTTSSTLILGSPMSTFTGPIGGTGEIMVTGSIDLPRTLSGTADPNTGDRADYDRSLDHEPPAPPTAGTPVSASRAVSTHTSARDIIAPPARSKKPSIVPILAITAGVLMIAVIAVVVTVLLTGAL